MHRPRYRRAAAQARDAALDRSVEVAPASGAEPLRDDQIERAADRLGGAVAEQRRRRAIPSPDDTGLVCVHERIADLLEKQVGEGLCQSASHSGLLDPLGTSTVLNEPGVFDKT